MTGDLQLGARWDGAATRFAVRAAAATSVELSLFDAPDAGVASRRVDLERRADGRWQTTLEGVGPGQLYGYRVSGPFAPQRGHRFNSAKLLVDPWARAVTGEPAQHPSLYGYPPGGDPDRDYDGRDSAAHMPKSVVVDPAFDWQGDRPPGTPWAETVIYEAHVRGLTMLHPEVPPELRGTYLGLAAEPVVEHLRALGVTAVELLPVQQIASERHLLVRGARNYWGYSTLAYFAPHAGYATGVRGDQVREWKEMVRRLHAAGLEVLVDVVYNHTAEGGGRGPMLSLAGFDNAAYYRLAPHHRRRYVDWTGCGNTVDLGSATARDLVLASLRYWVEEMHVDGFRFDLAPVLGREDEEFSPRAAFFRALAEDPVLSRVKLIAEPWDLGPGGYRLGGFPEPWREWNDRFRQDVRRYWRGDGSAAALAERWTGSRDVFAERAPAASVDYVVSHDGFTLADLTSYARKRNLANGEENRDGSDRNWSRNWGVEGPTDDPVIRARRDRARRNLLASVALAAGVPMLAHGDELARSQGGNNNPYCQDDATTWVDWETGDRELLAFVRRLLALRRRHPALAAGARRIFAADGHEVDHDDWPRLGKTLAVLVAGDGDDDGGVGGGGPLLLVAHGSDRPARVHLPPPPAGCGAWHPRVDTGTSDPPPDVAAPAEVELAPFTLLVFAAAC